MNSVPGHYVLYLFHLISQHSCDTVNSAPSWQMGKIILSEVKATQLYNGLK